MQWHLDKNRPICPQIGEQICMCIACGTFAPHERLLSVREVALEAGVNPNTVQKAYEQLEQQGLIYSVRGSGWFVGESTQEAEKTVAALAAAKTRAYFEEMALLGYSPEQVKIYVKEWES